MAKYTDEELKELGIERTVAKGRGSYSTAYIYKCAGCGRPVTRLSLLLDRPIYCNLCKTNAKKRRNAAIKIAEKIRAEQEREELALAGVNVKKHEQYTKAADIMRKYSGYDAAIEQAYNAYAKFGSTPEAVAAIAMIHAGIKIIPQQPVSDYHVDFALPDDKLVVEIDGSIYHTDTAKEALRDETIKYNLGDGWRVLHIPADTVTVNPRAFELLIKRRTKGGKIDP